MNPVYSDTFGKERAVSIKVKRTKSRLAVWSSRFGVLFFVPLAPALGVLLGIAGLSSVKNNPARTGKAYAAFGLMTGLVFTAGQAWFGWSAYQVANGFETVPVAAIDAGFAKDYSGMLDNFSPDASAFRGGAAPFIAALQDHYGSFRGLASSEPVWEWRPNRLHAYTLMFDTGHVNAHIDWDFVFTPMGYQAKIASMTISDARKGDLKFPSAGSKGIASASDD